MSARDGFSGSILFETAQRAQEALVTVQPDCFVDLRLDHVVDDTVRDRGEYDLRPYFYTLPGLAGVRYRQAVVRDLERPAVMAAVGRFAESMRHMRARLREAATLGEHQRRFWFLHAADAYRRAVEDLAHDLHGGVDSAGMRGMLAHLDDYVASEQYATLAADIDRVHDALAGVAYCIHIAGLKVTVTRYDGEIDYAAQVEATFAKFAQHDVDSHLAIFRHHLEMNHVEAQILALVAGLFPAEFGALAAFADDHAEFADPVITRFDREAQFLLAWLGHLRALAGGGLATCLPEVSRRKAECARAVFDVALAGTPGRQTPLVTNDYRLDEGERVIVVSGANQGGKTTFARTFGQLHHLAALGLPVPGRAVRLFLADRVFTHFKREEDLEELHSGLEDDILRIHDILDAASSDSVLVMNEIFSSTSLADARELGHRILTEVIRRGILCVDVSFIDELSRLDEHVVSMVAEVDAGDPTKRTFRLARRPADGLAHALAVAEKYGLGRASLRGRIEKAGAAR